MGVSTRNVNANALWNSVFCEVRFASDGIHLDSTEDLAPPELAPYLARASKRALTAARTSLDLAIATGGRKRSDRSSFVSEAEVAGRAIATLLFRPTKIRISRSRVTQFHFHSQSDAWLFDYPGFYLENSFDPAIGTFTDPEIIDCERTVRTSFVPKGPVTEFKYNLRLEAKAWNNGVEDGHAIIIIDPIFETSKL